MSINRVVLVGRPTRDPEFKSTSSGRPLLSFRLAFNTRGKNEQGEWADVPNFVNVTLWGNKAEALRDILKKGSLIGVDGKLRWREWEGPDGGKRSEIDIQADDVQFVGPKSDNAGGGYSGPRQESAPSAPIDDLGGEEIPF